MSVPVRTFGKYLLDEEIARGGMSRVFSARLRGVGGFEKKLVVKQVLPELASDPRFVSMFVHEAKTLVQMSHPHIAPVFELGIVDGVYFLAMEYVEGATLAAILRGGPLAPGLVAHLGAEVCDALHYAHTRFDIVHRDVTPRNVIVDGGGHSRLLDFGIAAPLSGEGTELFGTPGYLPPEQLEGGAVGPASDVFSLGAVLYEALTGRHAFEARTLEETRVALAKDGPRFEDGDDAPEPLAEIVLRALERDPAVRFGSARELGRALRGWLASAHPEGVAPELGVRAERAEREERRRLSIEPDARGAAEPATREVRTIATSHALDAILGEPSEALDSGTVRIAGRGAQARGGEGERGNEHEREHEHEQAREREREDEHEDEHEQAREQEHGHEREHEQAHEREHEQAREREHGYERAHERGVASTRPGTGGSSALPWVIAAALLAALGYVIWPQDPAPVHAPAEPRVGPPVASAPPPTEADPAPEEHAPSPAAAPVPLTVTAMPWAEVTIDGTLVGQTPQDGLPLAPGAHTVVLRCPPTGHELTRTVELAPGEPLRLHADLSIDPPTARVLAASTGDHEEVEPPVEPPRPSATVPVSINAVPWAEVRVDGRAVGQTPLRAFPLRPGRHTVELECPPLGHDARYSFDVEPGQPLRLFADMNSPAPTVRRLRGRDQN